MELKEQDLKATVREAMKEILAELRPMPVSTSSDCVTEIVIRSGSAGAMQMLGASYVPLSYCCVCPTTCVPIPHANKALLQKIQDKTGEASEEVIRKLELEIRAKQLSAAIEEYANKVGVK